MGFAEVGLCLVGFMVVVGRREVRNSGLGLKIRSGLD